MIAVTITFGDALKHDLWAVITGQDITGVSASKTYPGWKTGQTGSFQDMQLRTSPNNAGTIVLGDGSVAASDPGLLNGDNQFYGGKTSLVGLYALATAGNGEVLRVEIPGGGIG